MLAFDSSSPINCQLWVIFELIFSYLAFTGASFLMVLRITAIWNRNRIAVAIAICAWSVNVAFSIHNIVLIHASWAPSQSVCEVLNTETTKITIIATLASDVVLLLTMLVGLLRLRHGGTMFGLGQLLWRQGLIWLFLATAAEVPPAVFICLNLNYSFNLMFQTPALIVMSIGATRMHRCLADFANSGSQTLDTYSIRKWRTANTDPKLIFAAPNLLNREENTASQSEDHLLANLGQYGPSGTDNQLPDKPLVPNIGNDLENGIMRG